jgi:hypothetical protein
MIPKHPEINVRMTGESGHAFFIIGRVVAAMRRAGLPDSEREAFLNEATAGNYADLLATVQRWFRTS